MLNLDRIYSQTVRTKDSLPAPRVLGTAEDSRHDVMGEQQKAAFGGGGRGGRGGGGGGALKETP